MNRGEASFAATTLRPPPPKRRHVVVVFIIVLAIFVCPWDQAHPHSMITATHATAGVRGSTTATAKPTRRPLADPLMPPSQSSALRSSAPPVMSSSLLDAQLFSTKNPNSGPISRPATVDASDPLVRQRRGRCSRGFAPFRGPNGRLMVDTDHETETPSGAISTSSGFDCPLMWHPTVRACGAALGGGRLAHADTALNANPMQVLLPALREKNVPEIIRALDGACLWPSSGSEDVFVEGATARQLIGSVQESFDCSPPSDAKIAATTHHMTPLEGGVDRGDLSRRLFIAPRPAGLQGDVPTVGRVPLPIVPLVNDARGGVAVPPRKVRALAVQDPAVTATTAHDYASLNPHASPSQAVAFRASSFPGPTMYSRPHKARFVRLDNVCMSCETRREFFMNAARPCHTTLWSVGEFTLGLESKARQGRHGIFKEREGGFQFGGQLKSPPPNLLVVRGTTFVVTQFSNDNVGHVIRDAAWIHHVAAYTRNKASYPKPHHAMIDADLWNHSSSYYAFLTTAMALRNLGHPGREHLDSATLNNPRGESDSGDSSPPVLLNPTTTHLLGTAQKKNLGSAKEEKFVCFETAVFAGRDRHGLNSGRLVGRPEAAAAFRREMLEFLNIDPVVVSGNLTRSPRVYVYGRQDVHRRRLDNIGALTSALYDVTSQLGVPPPTVITTLYMSPEKQIALMAGIDILVSVQGAHLEQHLFMPPDATIIEIAPCTSKRTSFVSRYGTYHPGQVFKQMPVCNPRINFSDRDKRSQDLLLCPSHLKQLQDDVRDAVSKLLLARRRKRN